MALRINFADEQEISSVSWLRSFTRLIISYQVQAGNVTLKVLNFLASGNLPVHYSELIDFAPNPRLILPNTHNETENAQEVTENNQNSVLYGTPLNQNLESRGGRQGFVENHQPGESQQNRSFTPRGYSRPGDQFGWEVGAGQSGSCPDYGRSESKGFRSKTDCLGELPRNLEFDGTGDWFTFRQRFVRHANFSGWSEEERMHCLDLCMTGRAESAISAELEGAYNFNDLLGKLDARFVGSDGCETAYHQFQMARQKLDETLDAWADRVRNCARFAFVGVSREFTEARAIERFCAGLVDKSAGRLVASQRNASFAEAVDAVRRLRVVDDYLMQDGRGRSKSRISEGEFLDQSEELSEDEEYGICAVQKDRFVRRGRVPSRRMPQSESFSKPDQRVSVLFDLVRGLAKEVSETREEIKVLSRGYNVPLNG